MRTPVRPLCTLLLVLLACGGLADTEREALQGDALFFLRSSARRELQDRANVTAFVEAGTLASAATPEAALDAIQARVDPRCNLFERTSPTTAVLQARHSPIPDGCNGPLRLAAPHVLTTARSAEGVLQLELDVRTPEGAPSWWARRTAAPGQATAPLALQTRDATGVSLDFEGMALIAPVPGIAPARLVLTGAGRGAVLDSVWQFEAQALELLGDACRPARGALLLRDFEGSSTELEPRDVALAFSEGAVEISIDGSGDTLAWTEARCACGPEGCGRGPFGFTVP